MWQHREAASCGCIVTRLVLLLRLAYLAHVTHLAPRLRRVRLCRAELDHANSRSVVMLAVFAAAAFALRTWWLPEYRPSLRAGESYGLDVSRHQNTIDWKAVATDDIKWAYLKASEGGDFVDRRYADNLREARAAGLRAGAYHFFTFCRSGKEQADNFLRVAPPYPESLPPAVDIEYPGNCKKRPTREELLREVQAFTTQVENAYGQPAIVYLLHDVETDYQIEKDLNRDAWQRRLFRRPNNDRWALWQVSPTAHVKGITGPVDLNVMAADWPEPDPPTADPSAP